MSKKVPGFAGATYPQKNLGDPNAGSNVALAQTIWWVSPTGNDTNDGLTFTTALRTFGQILTRVAPYGQQWDLTHDTTVFITGDIVETPDVVLNLQPFNGSRLFIVSADLGVPQAIRPVPLAGGTLTVTQAINQPANQELHLTLSHAGDVAANVDQLIHDITTNTWGVIDADLGGNVARVTNGLTGLVLDPTGIFPGAGTWATGNTYQIHKPFSVEIGAINIESSALGIGTDPAALVLWGINIPTRNGGFDMLPISSAPLIARGVVAQLCTFDRIVNPVGATVALFCVSMRSGIVASFGYMDIRGSNLHLFSLFLTRADVQLGTIFSGVLGLDIGTIDLGNIWVFSSTFNIRIGTTFGPGTLRFASFVGGSFIGGSATITIGRGSRIASSSGALFDNAIKCNAGFFFGGAGAAGAPSAVGCTCDITVSPVVITGNVACTWANVDAAPSRSMFSPATDASVGFTSN